MNPARVNACLNIVNNVLNTKSRIHRKVEFERLFKYTRTLKEVLEFVNRNQNCDASIAKEYIRGKDIKYLSDEYFELKRILGG